MPELSSLKLISIDGPPGNGKTELARKLAPCLNARLILDQVDDNPYLERFLVDRRQYALHTQICSLLSRHRQQAEIAQPDLFHQITISDYTLLKDELYAQITLSADEFRLYLHLRSALVKSFQKPDLVLFLHARPEILRTRLEKQAPTSDHILERSFLDEVVSAYNTAFFEYDAAPLLMVDVNAMDPAAEGFDLDGLVEQLKRVQSGHSHFVATAV